MFLLQTTQEESGDLANNRELIYEFLRITRDGAYFVEAAFAVNHPSIPTEPVYAAAQSYGRASASWRASTKTRSNRPIPPEGGYSIDGRCLLEPEDSAVR